MALKFKNFWVSALTASAAAGDITLYIPTGDAANLPALTGGNTVRLVLPVFDAATPPNETDWEIVEVTAINTSTGAITVTRGMEGTVAKAWAANSLIDMRLTAGALDSLEVTIPPLPVNAQTGTTYTLALTDAPVANASQGIVTMNNAAANTLTVPPNSRVGFPIGTQVQVVQLGVGQTTIAAGAGVTVSSPSSLTARAQYSSLVLTQVAADVWVLGGDMT